MAASTSFTTSSYKTLEDGTELPFDFYPPLNTSSNTSNIPILLWFHAGGLLMGDRNMFFPAWLQKRVNDLGWGFITAEYRLVLPRVTVLDILDDVKDAVKYVAENKLKHNDRAFTADPGRIVVGGGSAGGWLAYLAAAHCENPKPKAIVSVYGVGGDLLTPDYVQVKDKPFWRGQPLFDVGALKDYVHPIKPGAIQPAIHVPLVLSPPGVIPEEKRRILVSLYLQTGTILDYYVNQHEPSLSVTVRDALSGGAKPSSEGLANLIPDEHKKAFPQFLVRENWPPTVMIHGVNDTAVSVNESRNMERLFKEKGVRSQLIEVEGVDHGFDALLPGQTEERFTKEFDQVVDFLKGVV